ncbi:MAG: hypothetical protein ABIR18_04815 [Chitinophagaceae bacterium]
MKRSLFNYLTILCISVVLTGSMSCNNDGETRPDMMDSAATDPTTSPDSIIVISPDTTHTAELPQGSRKSATLGLSYFPVMHRNETKDVNVYVSVKFPSSLVRDTLRSIVIEQTNHYADHDTSIIYTINVIWYKTLDITLVDPAGDFTITPIHPANNQIVDTINGNRWRWTITTKTDKKVVTMIMKVIAAKEDGTIDRFDDKTIVIKVKIDKNVVRVFIDYLLDNPKVSITILVSLFGFLGWYIKYRMDKKNKKANA